MAEADAGGGAPNLQPVHNKMPPGIRLPSEMTSMDDWKTWRQLWVNYTIISNLEAHEPKYQTAVFLNCIGLVGMKVYNSFTFQDQQETNMKVILKKFDDHAIGERNETYERYVFNSKMQKADEAFDDYLASVSTLAQTCNFCDCMKESLIRDQIIGGISSKSTRSKLLEERNLTLQKCVDICKSAEKIKAQSKAFASHEMTHGSDVNKVGLGRSNRRTGSKYNNRPKNPNTSSRRDRPKEMIDCNYCGRTHEWRKCPAFGKNCSNCNKVGHFAEVCYKSKTKSARPNKHRDVKQVDKYDSDSDSEGEYTNYTDENTDTESDYINMIDVYDVNNDNNRPKKDIRAEMIIKHNKRKVTFQVDSGAKINTIPEKYVSDKRLIDKGKRNTLRMWNNDTYESVGTCRITLINPANGKKYSIPFIVTNDSLTPLLGIEVSQHMKMITVNKQNITSPDTVKLVDSVKARKPDKNKNISRPNNKNANGPKSKKTKYDRQSETNMDRPNVNHIDRPRDNILPEVKYKKVFNSELGQLPGEVHLETDPSVEPVVLPPRRLPHAIKPKVKQQLHTMEQQGVIAKVVKPTKWVSQIVVGDKKNGKLRICIDPKPLNKALKRPHYQLPIIDDVLPDLAEAKFFSKLDLASAFWQIKLDYESSILTTFQTPFGRYRWKRLPFGTNVSSEIFQRTIHTALEGLQGVACVADDLVVWGCGTDDKSALQNHDDNLTELLERCTEKGIKLSQEKSIFRTTEIPFLGHLVTNHGLKPDPGKISAILQMPAPTDVHGVQRLVGFINYLSRFLPSLSDTLEPIRQLVKQDIEWHWNDTQEKALTKVKQLITNAPVLAYYNPEGDLTIQCDASGKGLGAALLQDGRPIAYHSRALTDTETRYASIEKEMLAVVDAMERFHQYTFGRFTQVISDHKPLEMIIKKPLSKAPKRLQGMLLRLQKYDFDIRYSPGKTMVIADTLSRAYSPYAHSPEPYEEVNMVTFLPIRDERLEELRTETTQDETLQMLKKTILKGWTEQRDELPEQLTPYYSYRDELAVQDGLIFKGSRVVVPQKMRKDMMIKIHSSHLGTDGCLRRARECLFWPHMTSDIRQYISTCDVCRTYETSQQKETLISHELPSRPWEKVGTDLFTWEQSEYLIVVDYYSNFWEIDKLEDSTSKTVVEKLKTHFARYGSPTQVISDNGPQFIAETFSRFAIMWDFEHLCSSPGHSQSNGKAESAVKTAKRILTKAKKAGTDHHMAFLDHRNTPTHGLTTSPAQRLHNRRTRTLLPMSETLLRPKVINDADSMKRQLDKRAEQYNKTAKDLKPLEEGDIVRMKPLVQGQKGWTKAVVTKRLDERSYVVETPNGVYRRNRVHLKKTNEEPPEISKEQSKPTLQEPQATTTKSKRHEPSRPTNSKNTRNQDQPRTINSKTTKNHDQPRPTDSKTTKNQDQPPRQMNSKTTKIQEHQRTMISDHPVQPRKSTTAKEQSPPDPEITTRSGRKIKPPCYLNDFV